jgi:hypothetical protein
MEDSSVYLLVAFVIRPVVALGAWDAGSNGVEEAVELRAQGEDCDDDRKSDTDQNERVFRQALSRLARRRAPEQVARWPDHVVVQSAGSARLDVGYGLGSYG